MHFFLNEVWHKLSFTLITSHHHTTTVAFGVFTTSKTVQWFVGWVFGFEESLYYNKSFGWYGTTTTTTTTLVGI